MQWLFMGKILHSVRFFPTKDSVYVWLESRRHLKLQTFFSKDNFFHLSISFLALLKAQPLHQFNTSMIIAKILVNLWKTLESRHWAISTSLMTRRLGWKFGLQKQIQVMLIFYLSFKATNLKYNRPFPSSLVPHFQNESKCETFHMKMSSACMFHFHANKSYFHRGRFTRYDFVIYDPRQPYESPTTWIVSCKANLQLVYGCRVGRKSCRRPVVSLLYATKSYRVNRP